MADIGTIEFSKKFVHLGLRPKSPGNFSNKRNEHKRIHTCPIDVVIDNRIIDVVIDNGIIEPVDHFIYL